MTCCRGLIDTVKLLSRLKREAKSNPSKAAVLAGLVCVAVWFWAPLVWGWLDIAGDTPAVARHEAAPSPTETALATESETDSNNHDDAAPDATWQQIRQWRDASVLTVSAELALLRDPFQTPVDLTEDIEEPADLAAQDAEPQLSAEDLNFELQGTIVSPRRRVALIDGQPYREGEELKNTVGGVTWSWNVEKIQTDRVLLSCGPLEVELSLPARQQVGRIELVSRSP